MAYESDAEPIKMGYIMDFLLPEGFPEERRADLTDPFTLVFEEGLEQGVIDRPDPGDLQGGRGLPKGSVKAVIDACPRARRRGLPAHLRPVDHRPRLRRWTVKVPTISVHRSEEWVGDWTFSLSMGSMGDEPIFWQRPHRQTRPRRHRRAGRAIARRRFRTGSSSAGRASAGTADRGGGVRSPTAPGRDRRCSKLHDADVGAVVHCGLRVRGSVLVGFAMQALEWDPPRFMGNPCSRTRG